MVGTHRLEAFSDGVLAIVITIMVLEIHPPHGGDLNDWKPLLPIIGAYILSFIFIGIYWNNHHHLFKRAKYVSTGVMWANHHLLFWLSIVPLVTAWMGAHGSEAWPAALYGIDAFACAVAYTILQQAIINANPDDSLKSDLGSDLKGKISLVSYALAIALAFAHPYVSYALFVAVAILWMVPDRRIVAQSDVS